MKNIFPRPYPCFSLESARKFLLFDISVDRPNNYNEFNSHQEHEPVAVDLTDQNATHRGH